MNMNEKVRVLFLFTIHQSFLFFFAPFQNVHRIFIFPSRQMARLAYYYSSQVQ